MRHERFFVYLYQSSELPEVSIVVPIGPGEESWVELIRDFVVLPSSVECVFVATELCSEKHERKLLSKLEGKSVAWCVSEPGRAIQLNKGASFSSSEFLWFLHADSRLEPQCWERLQQNRKIHQGALFYFNLRFLRDGPVLIWINTLGTWFRSHLFGLPFGDQGLAISKEIFNQLGGFSEEVPFGEDHDLVWKAKRAKVPIVCTGASIHTSARKYKEKGWLSVTFFHLYHTVKQASPFILGGR